MLVQLFRNNVVTVPFLASIGYEFVFHRGFLIWLGGSARLGSASLIIPHLARFMFADMKSRLFEGNLFLT